MEARKSFLRRGFHQAKWDEPVIFELTQPGERGILVPAAEHEIKAEVGEPWRALPGKMVRQTPPALPEMSQARVLRHYLRLSQATLGADLNIEIGQGTCTIKSVSYTHLDVYKRQASLSADSWHRTFPS